MVEITVIVSSSSGNCYLITDGSSTLILEGGISWKKIQQRTGFTAHTAAGMLVTHEHLDHAQAVKDAARHGLDIYLSKGTAEAIGVSGHRIYHVKSLQQLTIRSWTVLPFDTVHDAAEPLGFLLQAGTGEKVLFLTDSSYCRYRFRGITHMMLECNFQDEILEANISSGIVEASRKKRLIESHFSLKRVKDFLKANDLSSLKAIWLMHLSDHNSDEALFKREIQQLAGVPVYVCGAKGEGK